MNVATQPATPRAQHRLEPGDRFPDFVLPDQTGAVWGLYGRAQGLATAIFLDSDDALRQSLRALAEAYQAAGLDCLIVDGSAQGAAPSPRILADASGRFRQGVREISGHPSGAPDTRPLAFLLDRNQRVLALSDQGDLARWALTRWSEEPPAPAAEIGHAAPVLIVPNVLSRADCRALIQRWHQMGHAAGTVTSTVKGELVERVYEDLKKRRDHHLSDSDVRKPLMAMIARRLGPEMGKAFCFGSFRFDRVIVACYDSDRGDYFRRHRDNTTPATAGRRGRGVLLLAASRGAAGDARNKVCAAELPAGPGRASQESLISRHPLF
jgi:hypothetical protein